MREAFSFHRLLAAFLLSFCITDGALSQETGTPKPQPVTLLAEITGVIGPATAFYVQRAIEKARSLEAQVLILRLDTPGGLLSSTREIIEAILASPVPVAGYVAPSGAHAASAGTYILYATSIAAMAPGTNIGAATPVQIGWSGPASNAQSTLEKTTNDAAALIKSLAELRGRNADWAEKAVREAATLNARQALELHVIDLIAADTGELLRGLNGRKAEAAGHELTLATAGIKTVRMEPGFAAEALAAISNPNIALILMVAGIYGLMIELSSPGAVFPGVAGAIALVLGLYGLSGLPLDHAGFALLLLGMAFMIAEAFMPNFGVLGLAGIAAFAIGAAMLVDTNVPDYRVSHSLIAVLSLVSAAFLFLLLRYVWRAQSLPAVSGAGSLIGSEAVVLSWDDNDGYVWAQGERWHARGGKHLVSGTAVTVRALEGLTLIVESK